MSVGVVVRMDSSGLGVQSRLVVDLLDPDVVVAVDMGRDNRGHTRPYDRPNVLVAEWNSPGKADVGRHVARHLHDCHVVWAPETYYWTGLPRRLPRVRFAVHANPELWRPTRERNVVPASPTVWHQETTRLRHVPHPTPVGQADFDRVAAANLARPGPARRVLHIAAPAMLDRNGTQALVAALSHYQGPPFTLVVAGAGLVGSKDVTIPRRVGQVTVERVPPVVHNWELYDGVDLLVLPRRYAGQCLPANEAAAAGVPVLMSDLSPQDSWPGVDSSVVCGRGHVAAMRGGRFRVADPKPESIARRLEAYTSDDGTTRTGWQAKALGWARSGAWDHVACAWSAWLHP